MSYACFFAFPAIAGTYLPTPEGLKADLAWVTGYVVRQFTCPKAVTHPTTNRAQCGATALIETNALPLHQTAALLAISSCVRLSNITHHWTNCIITRLEKHKS